MAKNELTGGEPQAISPPAMAPGESVEMGPSAVRFWRTWSMALPPGRALARAEEAARRGRRELSMFADNDHEKESSRNETILVGFAWTVD